jgi:hypothetical protein
MATCQYCGGEIEFRYMGGLSPTPIHLSGTCVDRSEYVSGAESLAAYQPSYDPNDTTCSPTKCPKCGCSVYFIRHNGGSVWVDVLEWPWPKHPCMSKTAEPKYLSYLKRKTAGAENTNNWLGVIHRAAHRSADNDWPYRIWAAVKLLDGRRGALCFKASTTAAFQNGSIVVVVESSKLVVSSKFDTYERLSESPNMQVLGLSPDWLKKRD